MWRRLTPAQIAALAALAAFTIFITWRAKLLEIALRDRSPASSMTNKKAPDFALPSLEGQTIALKDYQGKKKLVISYWASWCGPCRVELPTLREFYKKYHKDNSDFEVLAVSIDEDGAAAEAYASKEKLPFPVLLDLDSRVAQSYSVDAIPTMFVINEKGTIVSANTGLEQALEVRLAMQLGIKTKNGAPVAGDDPE